MGLAVLDLYEGGLLDNGRRMGARLQAGLAGLADHPLVGDVRGKQMRILQDEFREAVDPLNEKRRLDTRAARDEHVEIKPEIALHDVAQPA